MKNLLLATLLLFAAGNTVCAQEKMSKSKQESRKELTPEERAKNQAERAAKKLNLNEQQKADWEVAALKRILVNQPHRDVLKGSTTPEQRKDVRKQINENNKAFEVSINAFMNETQKQAYKAWKEEKKKEIQNKRAKAKEAEEAEDLIPGEE